MAVDIAFGLFGRRSIIGSGDPGEFGEHGSLCFKLPDMLSILSRRKDPFFQFKLSIFVIKSGIDLPNMPMTGNQQLKIGTKRLNGVNQQQTMH